MREPTQSVLVILLFKHLPSLINETRDVGLTHFFQKNIDKSNPRKQVSARQDRQRVSRSVNSPDTSLRRPKGSFGPDPLWLGTQFRTCPPWKNTL